MAMNAKTFRHTLRSIDQLQEAIDALKTLQEINGHDQARLFAQDNAELMSTMLFALEGRKLTLANDANLAELVGVTN